MRVVLDTNIFISSVPGGALGVILDQWKSGKFTLVISDSIAREYLAVLNRPKFKIPDYEIVSVTDYLLTTAEFVTPDEKLEIIVADPADNKFLEAAVAGNVNFIVSGDNHLLQIESFRGIPIVTGYAFVTKLLA